MAGFLRTLTTTFAGRGLSLGEQRGSLENPAIPLSQVTLDDLFGDGYASDAGEGVTPTKALSFSPFFQAVSKISGDCAKLPLNTFRRLDGNQRSIDLAHPLTDLITIGGSPDGEIAAFKWWRRFFVHALVWGNAYAWIERSGAGDILGLYLLLPDRSYMARKQGRLVCVTEVGGMLWDLPAEDVLHVEGISVNNFDALNPVSLFKQDFGLALAGRKFTSKFFGNGANLGGILQIPNGAKPEAVKKVQASIADKFTGSSASFKTLVLRDGYKWFSTQVDPNRSNVDRVDERQTLHVAQMFNMDPSHLGVKGSVSYNSRETAKQDYHDSTLSPWLIGTRSELNRKVLRPAERRSHFIDYNINALLWADARSRSEIARNGILSGRFTINETRAWENLNPVAGGDDILIPLNMVRIDSVTGETKPAPRAQRDTKGDGGEFVELLAATLQRIHGRIKNKRDRWKGSDDELRQLIEREREAGEQIAAPVAAVISRHYRSLSPQHIFDAVRSQRSDCDYKAIATLILKG